MAHIIRHVYSLLEVAKLPDVNTLPPLRLISCRALLRSCMVEPKLPVGQGCSVKKVILSLWVLFHSCGCVSKVGGIARKYLYPFVLAVSLAGTWLFYQ